MSQNQLLLYFNSNKLEAKERIQKLTDFEYVVHGVTDKGDFAFKAQNFSYFVIIIDEVDSEELAGQLMESVRHSGSVNHKTMIILTHTENIAPAEADWSGEVWKTLKAPFRFSKLLELIIQAAEKLAKRENS